MSLLRHGFYSYTDENTRSLELNGSTVNDSYRMKESQKGNKPL